MPAKKQVSVERAPSPWERRHLAGTGAAGILPARTAGEIDCGDGPSRQDACAPSARKMPALPGTWRALHKKVPLLSYFFRTTRTQSSPSGAVKGCGPPATSVFGWYSPVLGL